MTARTPPGGGEPGAGPPPDHGAALRRDPARLAALRATGLLDTDAEPAFDRLTRLAVAVLGVPAAFLALVDEHRDFYKAATGLAGPLGATRELTGPTFCHLAIAGAGPLVVPDTAADPAYRDVPTVRSLGVAAYVGVPLVVGGQPIGSFCAIDTAPHAWTAAEVDVLAGLAESSLREIALRQANALLEKQAAELEGRSAAAEGALAALARSEERYALAARATRNAIWDWDLVTDGLAWNPGVADVFAYSPGDVADTITWWYDAIHPDDRARVVASVHAVIDDPAGGTGWEDAYRYRRGDGAYAEVTDRGFVVRDAAGRAVRMVGAMLDVTAERQARREVEAARHEAERARATAEAARHEAEAANRAKGEFLATMSHELRTPLNAIGGYAELLEMGLRGPVTEEQRRDLRRIQQSQRHLLGLVNEVLDLAKVDAGELRVERAAVRAGDTVDAALALVRPQAAAKHLAVSEACEGAADRPYLGDEPRVRQVLVNLLANAVKFTRPGGRVEVSCALTDAPPPGPAIAPGTPYVAIRVEDTGVGIPEAQQERVFEPFTQAQDSTTPYTRPAGGTGLGLAISRRLARLMGGDLTLESAEGRGSAFTLWLPTPERRGEPRPTPAGGVSRAAQRRAPTVRAPEEAAGLVRIGAALAAEAGPAVHAWVARLRADPAIPASAGPGRPPYADAELEDHAATFVTDVGLALRSLGSGGPQPAALLRDGTAILAAIAERHGAQRAGLGWPEAAVTREYAVLAEVLDEAVRRLAGPADAPAAARAAGAVAQLVGQAARLSLGGFRLAVGAGGVPAAPDA